MMQLERETINDIVTYTTDLLDEAMNIPSGLTFNVTSPRTELGRITLPIAKAIKAKLLILAASPLFNGKRCMLNLSIQKRSLSSPKSKKRKKGGRQPQRAWMPSTLPTKPELLYTNLMRS